MRSQKQLGCHTNDKLCQCYDAKSHPYWAIQYCSRRRCIWSGWLLSCVHHRSFQVWFLWNYFILLSWQKLLPECFVSLTISFGEIPPAKSTVANWYSKFGQQTLEDNHCNHPVTAVTVENVIMVKSLRKEDPRITHDHWKLSTTFFMIISVFQKVTPIGSLTNLLKSRKEVGSNGARVCRRNLIGDDLVVSGT